MGVFRGGMGTVQPFYDGKRSFDTIQLTLWGYSYDTPYHICITPSACKFYIYKPYHTKAGTYEFTPSAVEQGLVSFAISQLDFDDTVNTAICRKVTEYCDSAGLILETFGCYLRIKSADLNVDNYTTLYVERTPDALYLLRDVLESFIHDYSKQEYKTTEVPPEAILDTFTQKGMQKHISPPILEEWDDF